MHFEMKDITGIKKQITFTIPKGVVEKSLADFFDSVRGKVEMPGFRKGTAPIGVLRNRFGDQAQAQVSAQLTFDAVNDLISEHGIKIAGSPIIADQHKADQKKKYVGEFKLDGTFLCTVDAEVEPTLEVDGLDDIYISEKAPNIDNWISDKLESFRYTFADKTPVLDRVTALGDEIVVDLIPHSQDGAILKDGVVEFLTLTLSSSSSFYNDNLITRPIKEEFEFTITHSADYEQNKLAGLTITYKCFIHSAFHVSLHPIDDQLAQKASYGSMQELIDDLRLRGERDYLNPLRAKLITEIMTYLIARNSFDIPHSWIEAELNIIVRRLGLKEVPTDEATLLNLTETAHQSVRRSFILDKIYEKTKNIHLSAAELMPLLEGEGKRHNLPTDKFISMLKANGSYEGLIAYFEHNRTVDYLINNAKVRS